MEEDDLFKFSGAQPVQFGISLEATKEQEDAISKLLLESSSLPDAESPEERLARKRTYGGRVKNDLAEQLITGTAAKTTKAETDQKE